MGASQERIKQTEALPTEPLPTERDPEPRPPRRSWGRLVGVALLGVIVGAVAVKFVPSVEDPLADREIDRSQPVLLERIQDLSRYQAATGDFSVIIDLEKDTPYVPDSVLGERTLFVAAGSVDAYVDFSKIGKGGITEKGRQVTVRLPHAALESVDLDHKRSYVYAEERGVLNRVGDFFSDSPDDQQKLYLLAEKKIGTAAERSDLREQAEKNTRSMLVGMLGSLGYSDVTVEFGAATA